MAQFVLIKAVLLSVKVAGARGSCPTLVCGAGVREGGAAGTGSAVGKSLLTCFWGILRAGERRVEFAVPAG